MKRPYVIAIALSGQLDQVFSVLSAPDFGTQAACSGLDVDLFYPDTAAELSAAKAICAACSVITSCANWGVKRVNDGVLGGLSEKERFLRRGGRRAIDLDEAAELRAQYNFITRQPATQVAKEFGVDVRSVVRWRGILRDYEKAA